LLTAPGEGVTVSGSASGDGTGSGAGNGDGRGDGTGDGNGRGDGIGSGSGLPPAAVGPYRLGQGIEPPRKITHVAPIYPAGALSSRALGSVVIEVIVGTDGAVHNPKVIHSIPLLDEAALTAVRQWRFAPSRLNGVAVAVIVTIVVQFAIH
jgi:protein TonB